MELEEVVKEIKDNLGDMKESQIRMEEDLKYHIKRTDQLEKITTPVYRAFIGVKWSIGAILTLAALVTALTKLGVISLP